MKPAAAILAAAICFVLGVALGIRRVPPFECYRCAGKALIAEADDGIQPPDPWPADYWQTVGRA